jgi:hypothetical protein
LRKAAFSFLKFFSLKIHYCFCAVLYFQLSLSEMHVRGGLTRSSLFCRKPPATNEAPIRESNVDEPKKSEFLKYSNFIFALLAAAQSKLTYSRFPGASSTRGGKLFNVRMAPETPIGLPPRVEDKLDNNAGQATGGGCCY